MAEQRTLDAEREFEAWWESDGQYIRAGGGQYEKSFAYAAWLEARRAPPALDAEGLPELEQSIDTPEFFQTVCDWANKVPDGPLWSDIVRLIHDFAGQAQRDAVSADRRARGMLAMTEREGVAGLRPYEFAVCGKSLRWYLKADVDALLARQSAPEGAPVVKIQRGRVWIVKGNQSFMLAYEPDEGDDPAEMEWYADKLRTVLPSFTPRVNVEYAPVGMEAVAWLEAEASARGQSARAVLNSFCYSTRMHTKTAPVTSNPVWALYAPTSASAHPAEGAEHASHNKEKN